LAQSFTLATKHPIKRISRFNVSTRDLEGVHNLKVYLNDELAIDTDFELVRGYDGADEAEERSRRIRSRAFEYAAALVAGEHEVAVRLLFPEVVRLLGGRQAAISTIGSNQIRKKPAP
jgi:hypothetical protein